MGDGHAGVGHEALDHGGLLLEVFDAVVDEKDLALAAQLIGDGVANELAVKAVQHGLDGLAVGRGRLDDREVADAQERELQRAWNGRGGERERVHVRAQQAQLLFGPHAELVFFVDDE